MGKFSGILLCSDFDGTLAHNEKIVESNYEAIEYFKQNGGSFTLVTGRNRRFVKNVSGGTLFNTYVACLNGTLIYDPVTDSVINEIFMEGDLRTPLLRMCDRYADTRSQLFIIGNSTSIIPFGEKDFVSRLDIALRSPVYKLYVHTDKPVSEDDKRWFSEIFKDGFETSMSSDQGLEVCNRGLGKGMAARMIADLVGAETLICVGDYENDISMLKVADIGYAVENAVPALKAVADRITANYLDGAIAAVIRELDANA